jgi:hypothetical protein
MQKPASTNADFVELIPPPDLVRAHLERVNAEANLLRRLLRLALRRERDAARLHERVALCHE